MSRKGPMAVQKYYDLVIIGGGLSGLTLALQVKRVRPETQVLVLERGSHPAPEASFKVGESTAEVGSYYLSEMLGLSDHLQTAQLPKLGTRFIFNNAKTDELVGSFEFALNSPLSNLNYHLNRRSLENFLAQEIQTLGCQFLDACKLLDVDLEKGTKSHTIWFDYGDNLYDIRCRWVVDASGRPGILRNQLKLTQSVGHSNHAVWFRIGESIDVDSWSRLASDQSDGEPIATRTKSTVLLMGKGYWVWLIPLACGATSVGIVADPQYHTYKKIYRWERALEWLKHHEPDCAAALEPHQDQILDFITITQYAHSSEQVFSNNRWALTGDAGIFLDPFYSFGIDSIGLSNSFITELILHDFAKKRLRAPIFDRLFRTLLNGTLPIYEGRYGLFGNPGVMVLKIIWDQTVYWSFIAFLFYHRQLWNLDFFSKNISILETVNSFQLRMQDFFTEWAKAESASVSGGYLDQSVIGYFSQLTQWQNQPLEGKTYQTQLNQNIALLTSVAAEIWERGSRRHPHLKNHSLAKIVGTPEQNLAPVFQALHL